MLKYNTSVEISFCIFHYLLLVTLTSQNAELRPGNSKRSYQVRNSFNLKFLDIKDVTLHLTFVKEGTIFRVLRDSMITDLYNGIIIV